MKYKIKSLKTGKTFIRVGRNDAGHLITFDWCMEGEREELFDSREDAQEFAEYWSLEEYEIIPVYP